MARPEPKRVKQARRIAAHIQAIRRRRRSEGRREKELRNDIEERLIAIDKNARINPRYASVPHAYVEHRKAKGAREVATLLHALLLLKARQTFEKKEKGNSIQLLVRDLPIIKRIRTEMGHYTKPYLGSLYALDEAALRLRRQGFTCTFGYRFKVNDDYDDRDRSYGTYKDVGFQSYAEEGHRSGMDDWIAISLPKTA